MFFSIGCAALALRVSRKTMLALVASFVGTALFSFEGTDNRVRAIHESSYLENCIEKNFHVPNMRAGPCASMDCNFKNCVPNRTRLSKYIRAHRWIPWHDRR